MEKIDLTKQYKHYFTAKNQPETVDIEKAQFLSLLGKGDPSSEAFNMAIQALYTTAYALKFLSKETKGDFVVSKLEGLWWFDETKFAEVTIATAPQLIPRSEWEWRLMIRLPDFITSEMVEKSIEIAINKKGVELAKNIELFTHTEGVCVQMMHVGAFSEEPKTLAILQDFILKKGFKKNGLHHEIYLSDFRKTSEDKLKTILREPVKLGD